MCGIDVIAFELTLVVAPLEQTPDRHLYVDLMILLHMKSIFREMLQVSFPLTTRREIFPLGPCRALHLDPVWDLPQGPCWHYKEGPVT